MVHKQSNNVSVITSINCESWGGVSEMQTSIRWDLKKLLQVKESMQVLNYMNNCVYMIVGNIFRW